MIIREEDYDDDEEEIVYVTDSEDEDAEKPKEKKKKTKKVAKDKKGPNTSLILTKTLAQAMRIINEQKVSCCLYINIQYRMEIDILDFYS